MSTEAGTSFSVRIFDVATSTPKGQFALVLLVWLVLVVLYFLALRAKDPKSFSLGSFKRNNDRPLVFRLWNRTRNLAQLQRIHSDQLEVILEHVPLHVALIDENNRISYANPSFLRTFKINLDEPVSVFSLFELGTDEQTTIANAISEARERGNSTTRIRTHVKESMVPEVYDVRLDQARDVSPSSYLVFSLQEVSSSEKTLRRLLDARRVDLLRRVTSSYIHDLNNLLFVVRSGTDLVVLSLPEDHAVQTDLKTICDATAQATAIAAEMLAASRATSPSTDFVSATEALQGMEKLLRRILGRNTTLTLDLPTDLFEIAVNLAEFQQIVLNLVVNAAEAIKRDGKILVSVREATQDFVELSVEDNGSGIEADQIKNVFLPFFTTKSEQGCVGLGLSTVKSIVERVGGKIELSSHPETGTKVHIRLPKKKDSSMSADTPSVQPNGNAPTLLVLDDEEQVRRLMVRLLTRDGYNIVEAAELKDAFVKAKTTPRLDVWVTDANVDGTDATNYVSEMRELHPNVAIVLVSGREPEQDKMEELEKHGVTFLAKPFTPAELRQSIDQAYRRGLATSTVVSLSNDGSSVPGRQVR
jgi:two-component system cell cycle sensor histidine kinase/response regulator CckA